MIKKIADWLAIIIATGALLFISYGILVYILPVLIIPTIIVVGLSLILRKYC